MAAESTENRPALPDGVASTVAPWSGGGYLYRPGEVLVAPEAVEALNDNLRLLKSEARDEEVIEELGLRRVLVDVDVPTLVSRVRTVADGPVPLVAPNHVFPPAPWRWYTSEPPVPAAAPDGEALDPSRGEGSVVVVIDTGAADHPWFAGRVAIAAGADEGPDENGDGALDLAAGHGTFVAGVVLRHAPGATVVAVRADGRVPGGRAGVVDDLSVARALAGIEEASVVNLSLGGWTHDDMAPPATAAAVAALRGRLPDCVVVAAAGNDPEPRPVWPAALKGVVAVGALDDGGPWASSAFGWWVDAWAEGVGVRSTFLDWDGSLEHPEGAAGRFEGWAAWSGTSFAAPRVAGALAALAADRSDRSARLAAAELLAAGRPVAGLAGVVVDTPAYG